MILIETFTREIYLTQPHGHEGTTIVWHLNGNGNGETACARITAVGDSGGGGDGL